MRKYISLLMALTVLCYTATIGQTITTIAGTGAGGVSGDGGPATAAQTALPFAGSFDKYGNYFFAEVGGNYIRMIDTFNIIHTIAGIGVDTGGDGGPATAAGMACTGMCLDTFGNIYLAEGRNFRIRKIDKLTGIINTIAGNGTGSSTGDGGLATAATVIPTDVAVDDKGNIYFADNSGLRKIDGATGIISSLPAPGGFLYWQKKGNLLYMAARRLAVLDLTTNILDTIGGTGIAAYNGEGLRADSANFFAMDLKVDPIGNIYIAEYSNDRVRVIDTTRHIYTIAGTGVEAYGGDGGPATSAKLSNPEGVSLDPCGNIYIDDDANHRVRKVTYPAHPYIQIDPAASVAIGSTVNLTATIAFASVHPLIKWYNRGMLFATTTTPNVSYTKTQCVDSITAKVYGCGDSSTSTVAIVRCNVGVTVAEATKGIQLYPNPVSNQLTIESPNPMALITLTDLLGREVAKQTATGTSCTVNVSHLPPGAYIVRVDGEVVGKVEKE